MVAALHRRRKVTALMAINLTSTGVDFIHGRGNNKIVTLSMTFKELEDWAKKCGANMDDVIRRSFGRACYGLKKKFQEVIKNGGGVNGVPKWKDFEAFTKELRAVRGSSAPLGATLAEPHLAVAYKLNGWQIIGWPDKLETWSVKFQDGGDAKAEEDLADNSWRASIHRKGIRHIPRTYAHNPRRVMPEPFGSYVDAHLDEWANGAMYKGLAKMFQKYAGRAV